MTKHTKKVYVVCYSDAAHNGSLYPCSIFSGKELAMRECTRLAKESVRRRIKLVEKTYGKGRETEGVFHIVQNEDGFLIYGEEWLAEEIDDHICRGCSFYVKKYILNKTAGGYVDGMMDVLDTEKDSKEEM